MTLLLKVSGLTLQKADFGSGKTVTIYQRADKVRRLWE
jgi:hypothetical protein